MGDTQTKEGKFLASQNAHKSLARMLRRRGITNFDPNTPEGKYVLDEVRELEEAADEHIPTTVRRKAIEIAVEANILRRSLFTQLMELETVPDTDDPTDKAARNAYSIALKGYKDQIDNLFKAFKVMGVNREPGKEDDLAEILRAIRAKKIKVE